MPRLVRNNSGQLTEEITVNASAGAGDAGKVPELNSQGILADSILNAATTGNSKVLKTTGTGKVDTSVLNAASASAGAGDAGKVVLLDGAGKLDPTVMPTGIGADVGTIQASEALAAGDYVNIWDNAGQVRVRKADAATTGKEAMGFVLAAVASGANATVYFEGTNTAVTAQVGGRVYLSATQAGKGSSTVPTTAGQVVQVIGFATSATSVNFNAQPSIALS